MEMILFVAAVTACLLAGLLALVAWDVRNKKVDGAQPWRQALRHYVCLGAVRLLGALMSRRLLASTRDVAGAQRCFLLERLKEERDTEYGRLYDFASMTSVESFRSRHPLTTYDHYAPYVQRMLAGEVNVLTSKQPVIFGVSSGTSGAGSKIIPMLRRQQTVFFLHGVSVLYTCLLAAFPVARQKLRKSLKLFYNPAWRTSQAGIPVGPNSSTPKSNQSILHMYTTPAAGYDVASEPEAIYVQLLFALRDRHLGSIEGNFASLVYNAMKTLQSRYRQLASDLAAGTLNPELHHRVDPAVRSQLEKLLQPDPPRAQEVVEAFSPEKGGIVGVCRRLWPELYVVLTVDTGAFAPYGQKLRETFLQGVPIYSPLYAATEGLVGINLWPLQQPVRYLPHPAVQFFEFIPVETSQEDQPKTLLLHEVEPDHDYEVVLTNVSGLYRYRLGDIVRVVGFHNQCPTLQFLCRVGQFLNVRGEKTCERTFYEALSAALTQWPALTLVDYCCAESILLDDLVDNNIGPCYHVFLELECQDHSDSQGELTLAQREVLDRCLCEKSYPYSSFRRKDAISGVQLHLLRPGAFQDFRHYVISSSEASSNQFKVPRVVRQKKHVEFLWQLRREMT